MQYRFFQGIKKENKKKDPIFSGQLSEISVKNSLLKKGKIRFWSQMIQDLFIPHDSLRIILFQKNWEPTIDLIRTRYQYNPTDYPRSVAVNHAGFWILRHQFESGRGYYFKSLLGTEDPDFISYSES